jgi:hypothetical protein
MHGDCLTPRVCCFTGVRNSEEDELRLAKALSQREYEEEQERRRAPHQEGLGLGSGADVHGVRTCMSFTAQPG